MAFRRVFGGMILLLSIGGWAVADRPHGPSSAPRSVVVGDTELIWTDSFAILRDRRTGSLSALGEDSLSFHRVIGLIDGGWHSNITVSMVIGPVVSIRSDNEGTHGSGSSYFRAINLSTGEPVPAAMADLFDEGEIVDAMLEQTDLVIDSPRTDISTVEELLTLARLKPCTLFKGSPDNWNVDRLQDGVATVRLRSSGCRFENDLVLTIPIPEDRRTWFDEAESRGTVGEVMWRTGEDQYRRAMDFAQFVPEPWDRVWFPDPTHTHATSDGNGVVYGDLRWNNLEASVWLHHQKKTTWHQIFADEVSYDDHAWSRDDQTVVDHEMLSIAGPLVSFVTAERERFGASSRESFRYQTVHSLREPKRALRITEIFSEKDLMKALAQTPDFRRLVMDEPVAGFSDIVFKEDRCGILGGLGTSWAIMDFEDGQATVGFLLGSKMPECSGYAEIFEVRVPVPDEWVKTLSDAKQRLLLGRELPRRWQ